MRKILILLTFIIFWKIWGINLNKIDPTILSYFSEDLGETFSFKKSFLKFSVEPLEKDTILSYDFYLKRKSKEILPVILKGDVERLKNFINQNVKITDSIVTGYIDFSTLKEISDSNFLIFCEISKPVFQSSDSAAYLTRISQMVGMGYDGEGVNIGFIDDGFSPSLPIFKKDNISKFKLIWNQKSFSSFPPQNFGYGEEIDSFKALNYDIEDVKGHGTSLLSILSSESYFFEGLIKKSKIVAVNTFLNTKNLLDGIKYIVDRCEYFQKPFVLFMPLNYFWGSHSGEDLFEEAIRELFPLTSLKRGISVPAGNLGNMKLYSKVYDNFQIKGEDLFSNSSVLFLTDSSKSFDLDILCNDFLSLRFFVLSDGDLFLSEWIDLKEDPVFYFSEPDFFLGFGYNKDKNCSHLIFEHQKKNYLGIQIFTTDKENPVEFFIARGGTFVKPSYENFYDGERKKNLCSPASVENVISSGSYISRRNTYLFVTDDTLFTISSFNSKDDDILKPDIYSPGKYILSYRVGSDGISYKDSFGFFLGTSYSSIFTGVALVQLLQADSNLSVKQLYELIKKGADIVSTGYFDQITGYGFLNVFRSLKSQSVRKDEIFLRIEKDKSYVKIFLKDSKYSIVECINITTSNHIEVFKNFAIDRKPKIGKNKYILKILNELGEKEEIMVDVEFFKNISPSNGGKVFDLSGREVLKSKIKRGIYFEILDGKKFKKLIKF